MASRSADADGALPGDPEPVDGSEALSSRGRRRGGIGEEESDSFEATVSSPGMMPQLKLDRKRVRSARAAECE